MAANPVELLFGTYRRQVLGLLLLRPEEGLHVREISRLTGVPAGSLHRELRALTDAGLLVREPAGSHVRYRANRASPIYSELAEIFRKAKVGRAQATAAVQSPEAGYSSKRPAAKSPADALRVPRAKVAALCRKYGIAKVSLFGSAARGELKPGSDVDLMVEFLPGSRTSLFDMAALKEDFSKALGGRRVDIATPEILRNPYRRRSIVPDLKPIYVA